MHHRPLLRFLRRPAFTASAPARLTLWDWVGWVGLRVGLAYVRVTYGLRWSIASHYAVDALAVLPTWLYLSASPRSPLHGLLVVVMVALLAIMAYGLVALGRVARFRW